MGMSVKKLLLEFDSKEIAEWMAYDLTKSPEWLEKQRKERELELSRQLSNEQKLEAFKRLFKGK